MVKNNSYYTKLIIFVVKTNIILIRISWIWQGEYEKRGNSVR
jgi:hypothetical protein